MRRRRDHDLANVREIAKTTMHHRSARVAYLPGALDRIVANAPLSANSINGVVDYLVTALTAEEERAEMFPPEKWFLLGWFDWFDHAHEMV